MDGHPLIINFIASDQNTLALFITAILIWLIVISVWFRARVLRHNPTTVVTEYEPPKDISPIFARFIMTSGREGSGTFEGTRWGNMLFTLMNLYEDGLFEKLIVNDRTAVEYVVNKNYQKMDCAEEEKLFMDRFVKEVGMAGVLLVDRNHNNSVDGFTSISSTWFGFWHGDMYQLALSRDYMKKPSVWSYFLGFFPTSLIFGSFISIFLLLFFSYVGEWMAGIIMFPVLLVYLVGHFLAVGIMQIVNLPWLALESIKGAVIFFTVFSWFAWIVILGKNLSIIYRRLTPTGLELVRQLEGFRNYLATVDRGRLSFSANKTNNLSRNHTTFSWLGVFNLVTKDHWEDWHRSVQALRGE